MRLPEECIDIIKQFKEIGELNDLLVNIYRFNYSKVIKELQDVEYQFFNNI